MGSQIKKNKSDESIRKTSLQTNTLSWNFLDDSNVLRIKYGSHSTRVAVENQDFSSMTGESIVCNLNLNALISHIARGYYTQHVSINYVHFYILLVWDMVFI